MSVAISVYNILVYHMYVLFTYFPIGTDLTMSLSHRDKICENPKIVANAVYSAIVNLRNLTFLIDIMFNVNITPI